MSKFQHHRRSRWVWTGPAGTVVFSARNYGEGRSWFFDLDFHHNAAPASRGGTAPDNAVCWVTGRPCWVEIGVVDVLGPQVLDLMNLGDHDAIFRLLASEYERHFEGQSE